MIRPHAPFAPRYVDFGKVFVPNGALDFSTLAASDAEVARFGATLFNRGLVFPETSPFAAQIGAVSAALLMFEGGYLFTLVQRRREGELSAPGAARTDRPFNQVRFVLLNRETIEQAFAARAALYTSLAHGARDADARVWLTDYFGVGEERPWSPGIGRLDPAAPSADAIRFVVNALATAAAPPGSKPGANTGGLSPRPQPISVPLPGQDLLEKLQLVEAVQYWALPYLGVLSWAIDYVSIQNVHLRLFPLPPDAPAPLPPERVFVPGPTTGRFADDTYGALSALEHEALYDPALPSLLALPVPAAAAVTLFRVDRQAEPLDGAAALRLYPHLAGLGDRRMNLLRRVPRDEVLALLGQPDLPLELRLDLLQIALEAAQSQLVLYAPFHLASPRAARAEARVRGLLRSAVDKSPETALAIGAPRDQAELFRDLLEARRPPPAAGRGPAPPAAPLALAGGQPLLEALFLRLRTPALADAVQAVASEDAALFDEALSVLDRARDLDGLIWLWHNAGQQDFKRLTTLLERAVQPAWYPALTRRAGLWRELLGEGRALAAQAGSEGLADDVTPPGMLLSALPRPLVPFVWQASLAAASQDAVFAEWWLFHEALALPDQLPELWTALQRLSPGALSSAGPALNFLLGRPSPGMSLLRACTPPGQADADEALFATVLRAWLEAGFQAAAGALALAAEDVAFLIELLPGSNDILAAIAGAPAQLPAIQGLTAQQALAWAQGTDGERRAPYRRDGQDILFQRLVDLPRADEALLWHLLVEDEGSAAPTMPWSSYAALTQRVRRRLDQQLVEAGTPLRAYLALAAELQNPAVAEAFAANRIDLRRVLARLAGDPTGDSPRDESLGDLLPLAVFHLQETSTELRQRTAGLLRTALERPEAPAHLQPLPDPVLTYLRQQLCQGYPALEATGHWIDAELARRANAYRLEAKPRPARPRSKTPQVMPSKPFPEAEPELPGATQPAPLPPTPSPARTNAPPPPPPPGGSDVGEPADDAAPMPILGQLALPTTAAPRGGDSAILLWIALVIIVVVAVAVVVGAVFYVRSLGSAGGWPPFGTWPRWI